MTGDRDVLARVVAAFNTGDLSEVDDLFAPNYVDHQKPSWISVDGPDEFKQVVVSARTSLPNLQVRIEDRIVTPAAIAARFHWWSVDHAGDVIERETIELLHLDGGRIIEHWGAEAWSRHARSTEGGDR